MLSSVQQTQMRPFPRPFDGLKADVRSALQCTVHAEEYSLTSFAFLAPTALSPGFHGARTEDAFVRQIENEIGVRPGRSANRVQPRPLFGRQRDIERSGVLAHLFRPARAHQY